jgi:VIT family protein
VAASGAWPGSCTDARTNSSSGATLNGPKQTGTPNGTTLDRTRWLVCARRFWARTTESFRRRFLVLGVAAAHATHSGVLVAGVAGLVAGAMSMAAGEYVSVHSQKDTEQADLELERAELKTDDAGERKELIAIYVSRGLDPELAKQVAEQLMAMTRCARTPATNSASPPNSVPGLFRLRWRRPAVLSPERSCPSWSQPSPRRHI